MAITLCYPTIEDYSQFVRVNPEENYCRQLEKQYYENQKRQARELQRMADYANAFGQAHNGGGAISGGSGGIGVSQQADPALPSQRRKLLLVLR